MEELTNFEKFIEGLHTLAAGVRTYYVALIESGFTEEEAAMFTIEYQSSIISLFKVDKKGDDNG